MRSARNRRDSFMASSKNVQESTYTINRQTSLRFHGRGATCTCVGGPRLFSMSCTRAGATTMKRRRSICLIALAVVETRLSKCEVATGFFLSLVRGLPSVCLVAAAIAHVHGVDEHSGARRIRL